MLRKKKLTPEVKEGIVLLKECAQTCLAAIPHTVELEGEHFSRPNVSLLKLCADICQIAASTLLKGIEFHDSICRACASVCEACAKECDELEENYLKKCAETCRLTARACRAIAKPKKMAAKHPILDIPRRKNSVPYSHASHKIPRVG
jgi:hypothetical protein